MTVFVTYLVLLLLPVTVVGIVGIIHERDVRAFERKMGIRD